MTDDNVVVLRQMDRAMRRRGPGASLEELADEAGIDETVIKVAFPGGRREVVEAVIGSTCDEFDEVVTEPMLSAPTAREALQEAADGLSAYYEGGAQSCLFELFSVPAGTNHAPKIEAAAQRFLAALRTTFLRTGRDEAAALRQAQRTFAELQGTLILGRMTKDPDLFRAFTDQLPKMARADA
ncbi:hypothetical protein [Parvularcula oceani]|uniref:hypothetical protein n=1 Tax=Parvularcula oceani TaxID=1247963 RepID=UPI0004E0C734|nr:hypothetical protein [Parvularcula oceani]